MRAESGESLVVGEAKSEAEQPSPLLAFAEQGQQATHGKQIRGQPQAFRVED
jgi:hypothetical protein